MSARTDRGQRSLTGSILERNARVVVFHPDDDDGLTLTNHLRRMGFQVERCWPPTDTLPENTDLVFRALLPEERAPKGEWSGPDGPPVICVVAYENPTFIDQAIKMGSDGIVTTPIRASGLLSTVVMALYHARRARQHTQRIARLEQKLLDSRHLREAKNILMTMHRVSEREAYDMLRAQAMEKRVTIDDICHSVIQAGEVLQIARGLGTEDGRDRE
ncbi:ANTAR domain-containing protein (plasmid) [Burkholderia sp. KK1]|uniref:ANTAR domain-containing response regulator n=1 Tax=unclassified Caballeronia TaxID=2646786 RepID=UPI0002387394|nr:MULTISPECIES: ANTAR domain-containing protein [unclassified Caballeronia]AET94041.1 ANTAR domain protein [Burkholderia sp. YI23]AQH04296.1 ANTAR domain-containing protein [Burkholderia sp. KK1]BBQ02075.1 ANTAR protein [Burkholderia sp. SFA1]MCE4546975.1 ANTAR domain-containing protein [Caballeronia sp. PC1]MCE4572552.1 ANTAR domain-containing protein [Caballeronia sp. CLC5]